MRYISLYVLFTHLLAAHTLTSRKRVQSAVHDGRLGVCLSVCLFVLRHYHNVITSAAQLFTPSSFQHAKHRDSILAR